MKLVDIIYRYGRYTAVVSRSRINSGTERKLTVVGIVYTCSVL